VSQKGINMAKQRSSFAKLQRDRSKAAKRAEKLAAKQGTAGPAATGFYDTDVSVDDDTPTTASSLFEGKGELTAPELLQMIEDVHKMREAGTLTQDEFEEAKVEIFARLPMD
jgi:hypothetical protein